MTALAKISIELPEPPSDDNETRVVHWHRLVGQCGMAALEAAARAGECLIEQRDILQQQRKQGGSGFRQWIQDELPLSATTCYAYMRIAQRWDEVVRRAAQLPDGEVSVRSVLKALTDESKAAKREAAREARAREAANVVGDCGILCGDFRTADIGDESVDLIFTDPPYLAGDLDIYRDLSAFAARVLRPGGLCLAYSGNCAIPRVVEGLSSSLEYVWTFAVVHSGGDMRFRKWRLFNRWKPILAFGKPPVTAWWDWFVDSASGGKEKGLHPWQQAESEAAHYIGALCPPGGIVCDPCCGSGTTLAAAKSLGRRYIGIELDPETAQTARLRVSQTETAAA